MRRAPLAAIAAGLCVLLQGCAVNYQQGNKRGAIGFVWMEYPTSHNNVREALIVVGRQVLDAPPPAVRQRSLGIYLDVTPVAAGVGLGFRETLLVTPAVDAETLFDLDSERPLSAKLLIKAALPP